jgi:hypothetical protein
MLPNQQNNHFKDRTGSAKMKTKRKRLSVLTKSRTSSTINYSQMCTERKNCLWTEIEEARIKYWVKTSKSNSEAFRMASKELKGRTASSISQRYYNHIATKWKDAPARLVKHTLKPQPIDLRTEPLRFGKRQQITFDIKGVRVENNKVIFEF